MTNDPRKHCLAPSLMPASMTPDLPARPLGARHSSPARWLLAGVLIALPLAWAQLGRGTEPQRSSGEALIKRTPSQQVVRWRSEGLTLSVDQGLEAAVPGIAAAAGSAAEAWSSALPGVPSIKASEAGPQTLGFSSGGGNENAVVMVDQGFPGPENAVAVTVLTFDSETGAIADADIVLNGGLYRFARLGGGQADEQAGNQAGDDPSLFDVQAVLTHEMGHVLGLGEDFTDDGAVMFQRLRPCDSRKRSLTDADLQAIDALYADDQAPQASCSAALRPASAGGALLLAAAAVAAGARRRRRAGLALASAVLLLGASSFASTPRPHRSTDEAEVARASARWEGGLIRTEIAVRLPEEGGGAREATAVVYGGTIGRYTQVVGSAPAPRVGQRLSRASLARLGAGLGAAGSGLGERPE